MYQPPYVDFVHNEKTHRRDYGVFVDGKCVAGPWDALRDYAQEFCFIMDHGFSVDETQSLLDTMTNMSSHSSYQADCEAHSIGAINMDMGETTGGYDSTYQPTAAENRLLTIYHSARFLVGATATYEFGEEGERYTTSARFEGQRTTIHTADGTHADLQVLEAPSGDFLSPDPTRDDRYLRLFRIENEDQSAPRQIIGVDGNATIEEAAAKACEIAGLYRTVAPYRKIAVVVAAETPELPRPTA